MSTINVVDDGLLLSEEEQELKSLLDRVMVASTMQPLRDDLARRFPEIQSSLELSIITAQKRLMQQATTSQDDLKSLFESEFDAIKRRFSDELTNLSAETTGKATQEAKKTRALLEIVESNTAATLGTVAERMIAEFNQQLQAHQVEGAHAIAAIEKRLQSCAEQGEQQIRLVTQKLEEVNQSIKEQKVVTSNTARRYMAVHLALLLLALFNLGAFLFMAT